MGSKRRVKRQGHESAYVKRLESLVDASQLLRSTLQLDKLLKVILELALKNLNAARGTIYLIDEVKRELWSKVLKGRELVEIRLPLGTGIAGTVAKTGKTINLKDAWKDKRFFSGFDIRSGFQTKTMLCMPMKNRKNKIIGVFQIINKSRGAFNLEDELFLEAFSEHASLAIENAFLHRAMVEKEVVEREIKIAATIQQRLLPKDLPSVDRYQFEAVALPCKAIGGDYYDVIEIEDGEYVLVIADVSGKGIPAALLVSTLHAALHAYIRTSISLSDLVEKLNESVFRDTPTEQYITFFVSVLNTKRNAFMYVNAGHNPPYMISRGGKEAIQLNVGGVPLGMFAKAEYETGTVELHPGDNICLYTDGVTEAFSPSSEEYGERRFLRCLTVSKDLPLPELKDAILRDIAAFTKSEPQSDDLTLLLLRRSDPHV
ncbi:MAG: GAF domain-containing protein [Ignavibacteria bacterium]|nr:GAF domain-containing protein [Ignavibacteria bacterium]